MPEVSVMRNAGSAGNATCAEVFQENWVSFHFPTGKCHLSGDTAFIISECNCGWASKRHKIPGCLPVGHIHVPFHGCPAGVVPEIQHGTGLEVAASLQGQGIAYGLGMAQGCVLNCSYLLCTYGGRLKGRCWKLLVGKAHPVLQHQCQVFYIILQA